MGVVDKFSDNMYVFVYGTLKVFTHILNGDYKLVTSYHMVSDLII